MNAKQAVQTIVWRTTDITHKRAISGLTEKVFLNYLLEAYNIIASDSAQTTERRDFCRRQLGAALHHGEHVYRYDLTNSVSERITDHQVIRDNSCGLWGDRAEYSHVLAIISKP